MVIGSGPIVIGQAAEFDYAGTQACRSLKEEGVEVCLVNSNPATIMTDKDIADEVYIEPLAVPVLEKIIEKEKPDSLLPTLGGQAGLNLGMELAESGKRSGIRLCFARLTRLAARAAVSRIPCRNFARFSKTASVFPASDRCWWNAAFPAGKKLNTR